MLSREQILNDAIHVINQSFLGMFTTVDGSGMPHSRWMGSAVLAEGITRIYTLSGKESRKLDHLIRNPQVTWVFSTAGYGDIINLYGQGRVLAAPIVAQSIWDRLVECAQTYAMSALSDDRNIEFVTIETLVQRVELISPRRKIFIPQVADLPLPN